MHHHDEAATPLQFRCDTCYTFLLFNSRVSGDSISIKGCAYDTRMYMLPVRCADVIPQTLSPLLAMPDPAGVDDQRKQLKHETRSYAQVYMYIMSPNRNLSFGEKSRSCVRFRFVSVCVFFLLVCTICKCNIYCNGYENSTKCAKCTKCALSVKV